MVRETPAPRPASERLDSVDLLRGLVMVVMALDHTRDFFHGGHFDPLDLDKTNAALFCTRWVTHFCAPVFSFLAGTGAYLSGARGKPRRTIAWFMLTRGLWLLFLELTLFHVAWTFNFHFSQVVLITIYALGGAMVAMAPLVFLPTWAIGAIGVTLLAGHNAFDSHHGGLLWSLLHEPGPVDIGFVHGFVGYPLVPWIGVMASGYAFGAVLQLPPERRRRVLVALGAGMLGLFVLLRAFNIYGNTDPWATQRSGLFSFFSFINVRKYPPSLDYVLVTLGPSILALAWLDRVKARAGNPFLVFGRVPMFYYILHLYLLHCGAALFFYSRYGAQVLTFGRGRVPADFGVSLPMVYLFWILAVTALYFPCRWYAGVKRHSRNPWLSYL